MLLAREFIAYLSRQIVTKLAPQILEVASAESAAAMIGDIITEELAVEDKLNDEVREILSEYSEYMRREGVSYQEMFRRIKNTLITQRKVIRASGRDTGDQMKLSRDKINDLSHKLVTAIRKSREFRLKRDPNEVRLEIVRAVSELLTVEEKVDRAARQKIRSQKREIPEGTEEWDLLHKRYYAEELKKFGIELSR
ncbi:MAG: DUF507 family protein [Bryobacteraceae bacterium]|nr:DUF507 family protein [Bryobacterales bacterium]MEB2361367.1 DUF507 family protein [Bryobacterales bacterium]NUN02556.1 DUF507 family protein [Bryobacteraceae bacterium]